MKRHVALVAAASVLLVSVPGIAGEGNTDQQRAMYTLQKLGARCEIDAGIPGRPVVAVDLDHSEVHGETLKLLKVFPRLHTVRWREGWSIGQEDMKLLGSLKQLRHLDLWGFRVEDDWLKYLEELPHLESLILYNSDNLTNEGLRHLRRLNKLRTLNLFSCSFITDKGIAHLDTLTNLRHLDLGGTKISNAGLVYIENFRHLETLSLHGTEIDDKGLEYLKDLVKLRSLDLSFTKITDKGLKHLKRLTDLRHLDLDADDILGETFEDLKGLTKLRNLSLGANIFPGESLAKLTELKSLRELAFSSARYEDDDWKYLGQLANLESLKIRMARWVTDKGLEHLWRLTNLRELELRYIDNMTDKSLARLAGLTNLRRLRLQGLENISDAGICQLHRLSNLESLDLDSLPITREGWRFIKELKRLRTLCLTCLTVCDETLESLRALRNLCELQLRGSDISDVGLLYLRDLPDLQVLDLAYTSITNRGLGHLKTMPRLRTIHVEKSQVTDAGVENFHAARPGTKVIQYTVYPAAYSSPPYRLNEPTKPSERLVPLVRILANSNDAAVQLDILRGMHEALQGRRNVTAPEGWSAVHRKLAASKNAEVRAKALELSVLFGDPQALAMLRTMAADPKADAETRRNALQTLVEKRPPDLLPLLRKLMGDPAVRGTVLRGLASYSDPQIPQLILEPYASFSDAEKADAIATLSSRPAYALALLDAMEKDRVPRRDLSAFTVRQLLAFKHKELTERLTKVWGSIRQPSAERATQLAKYKAMVPADALKNADRKHGRLLFARTCASCHTLFSEGARIGPDLTGSQRTNPEYLLTKLIDPSAVVARDYQMTVLTLKTGRTLSGLIKEENDKTLTLQTQNEAVRLDKSDIEDRQRSQQSMMPDGLLGPLSATEVRDLIAYVSGPGQVPLPPPK